ncbi:hypothetical protein D3C74_255700 [compost metagenome]
MVQKEPHSLGPGDKKEGTALQGDTPPTTYTKGERYMDCNSPNIYRLQKWHESTDEIDMQADFSNEVGAELFIYIADCQRKSKSVTLSGFIKHLEETADSFGVLK